MQPEALTRLREAGRFGVPVLTGEISNWPHIARMEYNAVFEAEAEHHRIKSVNAALRAAYEAKNA